MTRPRLLRWLRDRFSRRVTLVVAPAGFGKTTLLAQAVAENRMSPAGTEFWLTCRADDEAGSSLAWGLCQSMGVAPPRTLDGAVEKIVETAWHLSPGQVTLVIDDVHEIASGSPGANVLARLTSTLPRNAHLVLAGRRLPHLPLSRLEVQGDVLRLGEPDLLFTAEELAEFYEQRRVMPNDLAACGGWPALAELAATAGPRIEADYLWEEVLRGIEPGRRHDLALLAHVGPVDDALASAVLGHATDVAELTANLPLVSITTTGTREIHGLWRPHLADLIEASELDEARRRAGLELARVGDIAAAVRLLVDARAWDDVTSVVADVLGVAHPPVAGNIVADWLGKLPAELSGGPLARMLGAVEAVQSDPPSAIRDLQHAADAFREEGHTAGELACLAQLGKLAWWTDQPDRLEALIVRLDEVVDAGIPQAASLGHLGRSLIADLTAGGHESLAELSRIAPGSLPVPVWGLVDWLKAIASLGIGLPAHAEASADRARDEVSPFLVPLIDCTRLQARWFLGHVDEVLTELPVVAERTAHTGLRDHSAMVTAVASHVLGWAGRVAEARDLASLARSGAPWPEAPLIDVHLAIAEATVAVAAGDERAATRLLASFSERWPSVGRGLTAFPQYRSLALWYVLLPDTRPAWDALSLGPVYAVARDLAQRLIRLRSVGPAATAPALPAPETVRALLPLPWLTELALAEVAAGRSGGWGLLEAVWPEAQPTVRRHAEASDTAAGGAAVRAPVARAARMVLGRLPVPPAGRLELRLLGPVELVRDGVAVDAPEWRRQRVRALLAALALHRSRPIGRERLADDLWPDLDPQAQSRNLRVTLSHLLRVLEPDRVDRDASFLVRPHGPALLLQGGDWFGTDLWRFDSLWERATAADADGVPSVALAAMREAVGLWRGDPSELAAGDWALPDVEERRLRLVQMATRAGELLLARGDSQGARQMAEAALRCDPWGERAHHVVVAAHRAAGHHRAALSAEQRYREVLAELGVAGPTVAE